MLDDLEIELRKLPGVRSAGFNQREDVLLVQLHVSGQRVEPGLSLQATRIAARHSEHRVAVELVRWRSLDLPALESDRPLAIADAGEPAPLPTTEEPSEPRPSERRVRLLAVLTFPDTDELEVHITLEGRRTIGRASASRGLVGAVDATVDALRTFAPSLAFTARWARALESEAGSPFLVACELSTDEGATRHGVASGSSPIEAAARSALHALNRVLARALEPA